MQKNNAAHNSSGRSGKSSSSGSGNKMHNKKQNSSKVKSKKSSSSSSSSAAKLSTVLPPTSAATATPIIPEPTTAGISGNAKEKNNYKNYAGLHAKTIKVMWEQFDKTDTDVHAEVYPRLADDATYKLWELANTLKTYSRHSAGRLTSELLNEVLKDSDVPPIIGSGSGLWSSIEYDGTYFYPFDEILDLRAEYVKEVNTSQCGPVTLKANWWVETRAHKDITTFAKAICSAIFTGNEEAFQYALHTTLINPFIGCIVKPLMTRCLQMLSFDYTAETLDRSLKFLMALVRNGRTREADNNGQLFHLSQLMTCLILGPLDLNIGVAQFKKEEEEHKQMEEEINCIAKELQSIKEEPTTTVLYQAMDVDDIQNECEALLQMMENEGFEPPAVENATAEVGKIKQELFVEPDPKMFDIKHDKILSQENDYKGYSVKQEDYMEHTGDDFNVQSVKMEPAVFEDDFKFQATAEPTVRMKEENVDDDSDESVVEQFSAMTTLMCDDHSIEAVCTLIGSLASQWGYFERESIYLISKRLEIFFQNASDTVMDYAWLVRAVRVLWALGEYAFREITVYFEKIDTTLAPEWIYCHFNCGATYIGGRDDIYFYEYLYDLCGDGILPYMVHYAKYLEKLTHRVRRRQNARPPAPISIHIVAKLVLSTIPLPKPTISTFAEVFPERVLPGSRKIGFKFAGCCPVPLKSKYKSLGGQQHQQRQPQTPVLQLFATPAGRFHKAVVICKKKLLKPLTNARPAWRCSDLRRMNI